MELLVEGISRSKSGNEQYQALRATEAIWPRLADSDKGILVDAIESAPYLRQDADRREVAERLLGRSIALA